MQVGGRIRYIAARPVKIAGKGGQAKDGPVGVKTVNVMDQGGCGIVGTGRSVCGIKLCRLINQAGIKTRNLAYPVQRILVRQFFILVKTVCIFLNVFQVRPAIVNNQLCHT